jgi:hypothetical protein
MNLDQFKDLEGLFDTTYDEDPVVSGTVHIICRECGGDFAGHINDYSVPECPHCGALDIE